MWDNIQNDHPAQLEMKTEVGIRRVKNVERKSRGNTNKELGELRKEKAVSNALKKKMKKKNRTKQKKIPSNELHRRTAATM